MARPPRRAMLFSESEQKSALPADRFVERHGASRFFNVRQPPRLPEDVIEAPPLAQECVAENFGLANVGMLRATFPAAP